MAVSDEVAENFGTTDVKRCEPDLIVGCGDVPFALLEWLANATEAPLLFVPGNHDPDLSGYRTTRRGLVLRAGLPAEPPWPPGASNVDGRVVDVGGLRVAGLGGCRRYEPGPNQYSERQQGRRGRRLLARTRWQRPRRRVDVLIAHAPMAGVGDAGPDDPVHQGFAALRDLVAAMRPRLFLYGHVTPAQGRIEHRVGETRAINVFDHQFVDLEGAAVGAPEGH